LLRNILRIFSCDNFTNNSCEHMLKNIVIIVLFDRVCKITLYKASYLLINHLKTCKNLNGNSTIVLKLSSQRLKCRKENRGHGGRHWLFHRNAYKYSSDTTHYIYIYFFFLHLQSLSPQQHLHYIFCCDTRMDIYATFINFVHLNRFRCRIF
jgi:hypothetical protein